MDSQSPISTDGPEAPPVLDVLGLGVAVRDATVWLDHFPAPDEKLPAAAFVESGGGPVPTALVVLSRLGRRCGFVGLVGDDEAGRFVRRELEREGVDTRGLETRPGHETPTSVILVVGPHRTICEWRQEVVPVAPEALVPLRPALEGCRALHVDARMPDAQSEAAAIVRRHGGVVMLDAGHPRPGVDLLLPNVDIAILSSTFPGRLPDAPEPEAFLDDLASRLPDDGPRIAGLTLGPDGCLLRDGDGSLVRIPGHAIEAVDTTGAGDVFHAAFLDAHLDGADVEAAGRFANGAAALKCLGRSGRAPLPDRAAIRDFSGLASNA